MKVRRYTYEPLIQRLSSPVDILTGLPHGTDHGGGRMVFGPDGKLYLSRGDHGSNSLANYCDPNHAQDLRTAEQVQAADWSMSASSPQPCPSLTFSVLNPPASVPRQRESERTCRISCRR